MTVTFQQNTRQRKHFAILVSLEQHSLSKPDVRTIIKFRCLRQRFTNSLKETSRVTLPPSKLFGSGLDSFQKAERVEDNERSGRSEILRPEGQQAKIPLSRRSTTDVQGDGREGWHFDWTHPHKPARDLDKQRIQQVGPQTPD